MTHFPKRKSLNFFLYNNAVSVILALLYAIFIDIYVVNLYVEAEAGDYANYLKNIDALLVDPLIASLNSVFYKIILYINLLFSIKDGSVLIHFIVFFSSFLIAYVFFQAMFQHEKPMYIFIFILFILFTPKVMDLFISNIRGGVAFALFIYGIKRHHGYIKKILIILSVSIHLLILPLLLTYILFFYFNKVNALKLFPLRVMALFTLSFVMVIAMGELYLLQPYNNGLLYTFSLFLFLIIVIFLNKKTIQNEDGFIAIALMSMLVSSSLLDYSIIRYFGIAFVYYGLFIINSHSDILIKRFIVIYPLFTAPFFYFWFVGLGLV